MLQQILKVDKIIPKKWNKVTMLLKPSEPYLENLDGLLLHMIDHSEDLTHLLYHLCLRTLRDAPFASPRYIDNVYACLEPSLLLFAEVKKSPFSPPPCTAKENKDAVAVSARL